MAAGLMIAGAIVSVLSKFKEGRQARAAANFEAAQQEQAAGQDRAAAQRQAIENRRQARLASSRVQALAGGGGADPTVVKLESDIAGDGELRALTSLYEGEERARGRELNASATRVSGQIKNDAAQIGAVSSALQSGSQMYSRFGGGGQ